MKYIKNFKMLKEQSHKELLSLSELRKKYPEAVLTMDTKPGGYFVRVDIKTQGGELKYIGSLRGTVSKEKALEFLNSTIDDNYDKYY
jgi:hypothetical protein